MVCYFKLVNNNKCVLMVLNKGDREFAPPKLALGDFGYHTGVWSLDKHMCFLTNINGNRLLDIVGFRDQDNFVVCNNGDGTFLLVKPILPKFCYDNGWCVPEQAVNCDSDSVSDSVMWDA